MQLSMLRAKIHGAIVTEANLHYQGSITIDKDLLEKTGIHLNEKVDIFNMDNGERFSTYVIEGASGEICLNGAAARKVLVGDRVIIVAYGLVEEHEAANVEPRIVHISPDDRDNRVLVGA
ncbi:MAG: aspartate 1-decarboxylase [Spirochaetales bacterium]|nr:aspartate 1-decarboxylase [Spirochaetales bacterium]